MQRLSLGVLSLSTIVALMALGHACSKENADTTASESASSAEAKKAPEKKTQDLEAAIAADGPKTVTAVGANGDTKVLPVGTTLAETDTYVVTGNVPDAAAMGADTEVTISLAPKTGWKINQEFPTKLKVVAPDGVTLSSETQGVSDASKFGEKSAVFAVKFKPTTAGAKSFSADFKFAVCTDATCDPKQAKLAWNLDVK